MSFNALVLAGTRPGGDPLARAEGVSHKGLIAVAGQPIIVRVLAALREAGAARIGVVADDPAIIQLAGQFGAEIVAPAPGPSASAAAGFAQIGEPLVVTTSDHALLRAEWVRQLVRDAPPACDVAVMLARRDAVERALPGSARTYLRFADGEWSGCNLFLLGSPAANSALVTWQRIEADRKRPWKVVSRLGPMTLLDYLFGRLTLAEGIARLGRRIGIDAALVAAEDGLAAVDVDKLADLVAVRGVLSRAGNDA